MWNLGDLLRRAVRFTRQGVNSASAQTLPIQFSDGHALVVGVGDDLPGTVDDAKAIHTILTDPGRCGYPREQVRLLTGRDANRAAVLSALNHLASTTTSTSTVIVYFSGHGYRLRTQTGWCYFLLPSGYDTMQLEETTVDGETFRQCLTDIRVKKMLLLLDCCHAGGIEVSKAPGFEKAPLPAASGAELGEGQGRVVIASSKAEEVSLAGRPYSFFTRALLEALAGEGASVKDGYVRASDLALYTHKVVSNRTRGRQNPILHFRKADDFAVAYYSGGEKEPKALRLASAAEGGITIQIGSATGRITINVGDRSDGESEYQRKRDLFLAVTEDAASFINQAKLTDDADRSLKELRSRGASARVIRKKETEFNQLRVEHNKLFSRIKRHFEDVRLSYASDDVRRSLDDFSAWWNDIARTEGEINHSPESPGQAHLQALLNAMRRELNP